MAYKIYKEIKDEAGKTAHLQQRQKNFMETKSILQHLKYIKNWLHYSSKRNTKNIKRKGTL